MAELDALKSKVSEAGLGAVTKESWNWCAPAIGSDAF